jgi:hypothetical protein
MKDDITQLQKDMSENTNNIIQNIDDITNLKNDVDTINNDINDIKLPDIGVTSLEVTTFIESYDPVSAC